MNLLYYVILIGGILIVSLYFYKKIKNFNTLPDVVEDATTFVIEEQEIDALEFVCAFNPRSISAKQKV